ncbi:hypothetical protein ACHAQG_003058 [Verticillium nonalfalfae]
MDTVIPGDIADQHASNTQRSRARILNEHKRRVGSNEDQGSTRSLREMNESHEASGPLREIINVDWIMSECAGFADAVEHEDQQDSLYKYINWEDPLRTLGAYFTALTALIVTHYYPWTQLALKYGAISLGVVSVTEFANRQFTSQTLLSRLRPTEYRTIPESTLNATLKDVHDFVQYAIVKLQKVALGQELDRTFAAFLVITSIYFLSGILSPFGFIILGLTSLFVAPLVTSARGREVARDARVQAEKLGTAAADNSNALASGGKAKLAEGSARVRESAAGVQQRVGGVTQATSQTAADLTGQVRETVSHTAEDVRKLPEMGSNALSSTLAGDDVAENGSEHYTHEASPLGDRRPAPDIDFTTRYPEVGQGEDERFGSVPGTVSKVQVSEETA